MPLTCIATTTVRLIAARRSICVGGNSVVDRDRESGEPTMAAATPIAVIAVRAQNRSTAPNHVGRPLNTTSLPKAPAARAPTKATSGRIRAQRLGPGRRLDITAAASTRGPDAIATTRWVNSMSGLNCHCGAISSGRQPGQVGQEAPDPVAHTTAPIATAKKVNSAARRNKVSAAVGGAEAFWGTEVSPGSRRRAAPARSTPYASGKAASDEADPAH